MPDHFTARLALPYPDIDDPANVPADMQQLAERLDVLIPAGAGAGLALNRATIGDVGMAGQVRAGRQLTVADFTSLGIAAPLGLWNLSDLTDASGNARALINKGAVTFATGINGAATTAAQFIGSTAQALYIADTGAADPFRIKTGSWGCWFRTAKRATVQALMGKNGASLAVSSWSVSIHTNNLLTMFAGDGTTALPGVFSVSDVCDDRWHHVVISFDGTTARMYVDGVLEAAAQGAFAMNGAATAPLNIGGYGADGATAATNPHYGRVDEAFVTGDVLSDDQVRNLYCARIAHTLAVVPTAAKLNVTRRRRGGAWAVADFPVQPLRLYNFTAASLADQGSGGQALVPFGTPPVSVGGADGAAGGAYSFNGTTANSLMATDAGLPQGTASRSYGVWFKSRTIGSMVIVGYGTVGTGDARLYTGSTGALIFASGSDQGNSNAFVCDGNWHLAVVVEDNAAIDGIKRKLYLDGRLISGSTVLNPIVLAGANRYRVGADSDGSSPYAGLIDGAFVSDAALTFVQVAALWAKGSQSLAPSPKNAGDHVEAWDAAAVYATFDSLDSNWQVDLGVAA